MQIALLIILVCTLVFAGVLAVRSRGKPAPVLDEGGKPAANSISEKIRVPINGVEQGMFLQGRDLNNPVLLFVHGGPGMPEYFLTERYPTGLEDLFTVCWWDQRGAGLSYSPSIPPESMTLEQLVDDTLEVTNYLRGRFHQEKIYLMGHSGGSFIGIRAAARAPQQYHAYIGMGQMVYQIRSENLAYEYMLQKFRENGDQRMVRRLEAARPSMTPPLPPEYMALRDEAMHSLGVGTTRQMKSVISGVFFPSWWSPQYTLGEKVNLWRGKIYSANLLRGIMFATDLTRQVNSLDLPVYFFHGRQDYTVCYDPAKEFFTSLEAPLKGFYTFEQSAHSPIFEEPEKIRQIMREDVLAGKIRLADAP